MNQEDGGHKKSKVYDQNFATATEIVEISSFDWKLKCAVMSITKTCPCNIQRFFTAVKMKSFR